MAARIRGGRLDRVVGGKGWLLGDAGGGFWIGHSVARAVVASLDGQAQDTALTGLVLNAMGIEADTTTVAGRAGALRQLVSALYARPPISLAEFAPLAFAAHEDQAARPIRRRAGCAQSCFLAAYAPDLPGPVVVGGSIIVRGFCWLRLPASRPSLSLRRVAIGDFGFLDGLAVRVVLVSGMRDSRLTSPSSVRSSFSKSPALAAQEHWTERTCAVFQLQHRLPTPASSAGHHP